MSSGGPSRLGQQVAPVTVEIPSDDEDADPRPQSRPLPPVAAERDGRQPQVLVVLDDDDPTPQKKATTRETTPSFVSETPASTLRRCSTTFSPLRPSRLICVESDDDDGDHKKTNTEVPPHARNEGQHLGGGFDVENENDSVHMETSSCALGEEEFNIGSSYRVGHDGHPVSFPQEQLSMDIEAPVHCDYLHGSSRLESTHSKGKKHDRITTSLDNCEKNEKIEMHKKKKTEKQILMEERKRKRQEEKLQKESLKAEAAQMKKLQREKDKWEKGKFALKSIIAEIDTKVVENGAIGGHLLGKFAEKGVNYRITRNPIEKSILWKMSIPDEISKLSTMGTDVSYVLFVFEAEEFCNLVLSSSFYDHVYEVQRQYPSFTACYITNKLMSYVKKREQNQYKNPSGVSDWRRPPIEEVFAKLTTDFNWVHSRLCMDEADLAEHIVGLTSSLASCRFRNKLTWLSINANGSLVPKGFIDKNLIKRSSWLKALVAIPRVQPRFAIAISKKYPTMRSLLKIYMDSNISVHDKEFLLKDLRVEDELGNKRVGEAHSKRVYRILMSQNGISKTDDVEKGADFF